MELVKVYTDDWGTKYDEPAWHLASNFGDSLRIVCSGECFGDGESRVEYETKNVKRGGITCLRCLEIIKWYKSIKL